MLSAGPLLVSAVAAVALASAVWAVVFVAFGSVGAVAAARATARRGAVRLCSWQEVDRDLARLWRRRWLHPLAFRRSLGARRRVTRAWRPTGGTT